MANETVLVSEASMDPQLKTVVLEACERAKVQHVLWSDRSATDTSKQVAPSLLVASLPAGKREIPEDMASIMTKSFPGLPLLLLCDETLIRQSVTLQNGRVTLLGTPLNLEKISSRIRTALAVEPDAEGGRNGRSSAHGVREYRGPHWWAASLAKAKDDDSHPQVESHPETGFAAVLPLPSRRKSEKDLERVGQILRSGIPDDKIGEALKEVAVAGLWLSAGAKTWSFYTGDPAVSFWLVSPRRLPRYWNVSAKLAQMKAPYRTFPASSGDLALVGTKVDPLVKSGSGSEIPADTVNRFADGGGPAMLDHLDSKYSNWSTGFSSVIVEVR